MQSNQWLTKGDFMGYLFPSSFLGRRGGKMPPKKHYRVPPPPPHELYEMIEDLEERVEFIESKFGIKSQAGHLPETTYLTSISDISDELKEIKSLLKELIEKK